MKESARILVNEALKIVGVVSPTEEPSDTESAHALRALNLLIEELNNDTQFPYSSSRIDVSFPSSGSEFTIGEGEGIALSSIVSDGVIQTYTTKKDHPYIQADLIEVYDTTNYNLDDKPVLSGGTDREFIVATQETPASTEAITYVDIPVSVGLDGAVVFDSASSFLVGEVIVITDKSSYSLVATVKSITNPTTYILEDVTWYEDGTGQGITGATRYTGGDAFLYSTRVTKEKERSGYVFKDGELVPDIRAPRPHKIEELYIRLSDQLRVLDWIEPSEFDSYSLNNGSGFPWNYTYYSEYPFGKIVFDSILDASYTGRIKYENYISTYELSDEIDLPAGYLRVLQYYLASELAEQYGFNGDKWAQKAQIGLDRLRVNNFKGNVLKQDFSSGGSYNIRTDGWQ